MMTSTEAKLVVRDFPIFLWLLGAIFAGVGALILFEGTVPVMGLLFLLVGLAFLLFTGVLTVTADGITRTLKIEHRSALRHKLQELPFDALEGIGVERKMSHGKGARYTYQVVFKLKDGEVLPLRAYSSSGLGKKERLASQLRDFTGLPVYDTSPAAKFYAAMQLKPGEIHESNGVRWQVEPLVLSETAGTRWFSPDCKTLGFFLVMAQKAAGQSSQGFLATLGSMIFKHTLSVFGFRPEDTPGLEEAVALAPLDPALEPHFMAFTNAPDRALPLLSPGVVALLADRAGKYPVKQFQQGAGFNQIVVLFGPNGVCISTISALDRGRLDELAGLGVGLVKEQAAWKSGFSSL